jgi:hypothetical protein
MTTRNPFPGMNPFFEQRWRDAHTTLITYSRDALQEHLPPDLVAVTEEEVVATRSHWISSAALFKSNSAAHGCPDIDAVL